MFDFGGKNWIQHTCTVLKNRKSAWACDWYGLKAYVLYFLKYYVTKSFPFGLLRKSILTVFYLTDFSFKILLK